MRWEFFLSRSTPGSLPDGLFRFRSSVLSVFGPCTCGNGGCVCRHHGSLGSCLLLSLDLCALPWLFQSVRACKVGIQVCWMFSSCLLDCLAKSLQTSFFLLFPWDLVFPQSVGHSVLRMRMIVFLCRPIFGCHWNVFWTISWSPIGCFRCVFCHTTDTLPCVSVVLHRHLPWQWHSFDCRLLHLVWQLHGKFACSRVKLVFHSVSASDQLGMSREGLTSGCATFVLATKTIHVSSSGLGLSLAVVSSSVLSTRCEKILFFDLCVFFFFRSSLSFFSHCFLRHVLFAVLDVFLVPVLQFSVLLHGLGKVRRLSFFPFLRSSMWVLSTSQKLPLSLTWTLLGDGCSHGLSVLVVDLASDGRGSSDHHFPSRTFPCRGMGRRYFRRPLPSCFLACLSCFSPMLLPWVAVCHFLQFCWQHFGMFPAILLHLIVAGFLWKLPVRHHGACRNVLLFLRSFQVHSAVKTPLPGPTTILIQNLQLQVLFRWCCRCCHVRNNFHQIGCALHPFQILSFRDSSEFCPCHHHLGLWQNSWRPFQPGRTWSMDACLLCQLMQLLHHFFSGSSSQGSFWGLMLVAWLICRIWCCFCWTYLWFPCIWALGILMWSLLLVLSIELGSCHCCLSFCGPLIVSFGIGRAFKSIVSSACLASFLEIMLSIFDSSCFASLCISVIFESGTGHAESFKCSCTILSQSLFSTISHEFILSIGMTMMLLDLSAFCVSLIFLSFSEAAGGLLSKAPASKVSSSSWKKLSSCKLPFGAWVNLFFARRPVCNPPQFSRWKSNASVSVIEVGLFHFSRFFKRQNSFQCMSFRKCFNPRSKFSWSSCNVACGTCFPDVPLHRCRTSEGRSTIMVNLCMRQSKNNGCAFTRFGSRVETRMVMMQCLERCLTARALLASHAHMESRIANCQK